MDILPDYMQENCRILKAIFPYDISEEDIEILVFLLHQNFSQRNLATLISSSLNKDYHRLLNIVSGAGTNEGEKNLERLEEIRTDLIINGYEGELYDGLPIYLRVNNE